MPTKLSIKEIIQYMRDELTEDERMEITRVFCPCCGSENPCYCMHDE